jgi:hypothetical protein
MNDDYDDYDDIDIAIQQDAERELNRRPRCIYNRVDPRQNFTDPVFKSHFRWIGVVDTDQAFTCV